MTATEAHLTTGWEHDTPVQDSILRQYVLNQTAWFETFARAADGRTIRTPTWAGAEVGRPAGFFNSGTHLQPLLGDALDETLGEIEAWFAPRPSFLWSPWPTPDLQARNWHLVGHPPLLFRFPGGPVPPAHHGLRVVPVTDLAGVRDWEHVIAHGFPIEDLQPRPHVLAGGRILDDPRVRLWVGYEDDRPVTTGALFFEAGLAQFALAATLPEARRRGYWFTMLAVRLQAAGTTPTAALFSDDSRPGAERVGFMPLLRFTCWHRPRRH
jgi:hypothetical protein